MLLLLTQLQKILQLDHKTNITQDHQKIGNLTTKDIKKLHLCRQVGRRGGVAWGGGRMGGPTFTCGG